jgi:PAS domain S-box-containing protein
MTIATNRFSHSRPYFDSRSTLFVVCVTTALSYLVPKLAGMLTSNPQTVWPLWPGCAILVAGLLLVPVSVWPLLIPASFAGFTLVDLQAGVPLSSIAWFIPGNTVEVLISAIGLRYCFDGMPRLNSVRALAKYSFFAIVLAPFAAAFLSAHGIGRDYWTSWKIVFLSEVLAFVTVTPALLSWISERRVWMRKSRALHLEGVMLIAGLVLVSYVVFTLPENNRSPALFYTLVPFLLWSALRFGWLGISTSLIAVTSLSIWGAVNGRGPFSNLVPLTDPLPLQMFLVFASIPFMVLAALAEEREESAHVVRESEERFRLVANTAPVLIWMSGTDKLCTYFNKPWLDFTGRSLSAQLGNGWVDGIHLEDQQRCLDTYTRAFDGHKDFRMEYRLRRNDGEYRWVLDIGVPRFNPDGSFAGYIGSCMDVTERKLAEEALSSVSSRLIEAQEQERTRIARDLHDDINQRLALLAIEMGRVKMEVPDVNVEVLSRMDKLRKHTSEIASDIQALSHQLHSPRLEYLGLVAAMEGFCQEFGEKQKLEIDFKSHDLARPLPPDISLSLFRVLQEALHNAAKHSGGSRFAVRLWGTPGEIHLMVNDAGAGFDVEGAMKGRGLGLVSMRERLRLVNGKLSIQSEPGRGTTVLARVPLGRQDHSVAIAG